MSTPAVSRQDVDLAAVPLRRALGVRLVGEGLLEDPAWRHAVETVPRHHFVPGFYLQEADRSADGLAMWKPVTAQTDRQRWLEAVYTDQTLITQFDGDEPDWDRPTPRIGGAPTSSSTLPSLVVRMWADADLHDGHDVLEIGTGTGYSTALACERLGDSGSVTSVEVDPRRLDKAATALYGNGHNPILAVADGLYGYWPHAPYDRIIAGCSVRTIPDAWLAQTRPGGKILTTLSGWLYGYARMLLTVREGSAEGPLLPGTISFMAARTQNPPGVGNPAHWAGLTRDADPRSARHSPDRLEEATSEGFFARFLAQLAAPNAQLASTGDTVQLIDVTTGSAAAVTQRSGVWQVRQAGPVRLWDAVETVWDAWGRAGRPGPESFRMRIGEGRQTIHNETTPSLSFVLP
jgi:methyltransferase of ATP-grasp peptide maturase system